MSFEPHLTVPRTRRRLVRQPGVTTHTTTRPFDAADVHMRQGIRVTTPARTIADVAESGAAPEQVLRAARQAIDRGLTTEARLRASAEARSRRVSDSHAVQWPSVGSHRPMAVAASSGSTNGRTTARASARVGAISRSDRLASAA